MKTQITQEEVTLTLSDDRLDNDNFVTLTLRRDGDFFEQDFLIDELLPAIHAFEMKRSRREYRENNRKLYALKEIEELDV